MKKKRVFVLGTVALFLVASLGLTGCNLLAPDLDYDVLFNNQSRFPIRVEILPEYTVSHRSFTLNPGSQRTVGTNNRGGVRFSWHRTDTGNQSGVTFANGVFR